MSELTPEYTEAMTRYTLEITSTAMDPLMGALDLVPDGRLGEQPVPEQLPIGRMIEHALGAVAFTARAIRLGKCEESDVADLMAEDESTGTRSRIRDVEKVARSELESTLAGLDADMAANSIDYWFGWQLTGLETAGLGYQELVHHRGQIQSFLRLMGFTPPDLYAPPEGSEEATATAD
jgi:uncharacterized damage-inducible protein DinB